MTPSAKKGDPGRVRARGRARERPARSSVKPLLIALVLCVPLAACSSGDDSGLPGAPLDCSWFSSENCWKTLVADAVSCVPPADETGVLSADGSACTYESGASVDFGLPLNLPLEATSTPPWYFTQSSSGDECVRFDSRAADEFTLSVHGMTFVEKSRGFALQVTCPDGTQYATDNGPALFDCPDYSSGAPGNGWVSSDVSVKFWLYTGHGDGLGVFDCGK
jgi:hypothetical protein